MRIGLPRALMYYRYGKLWESFFREIGCEILLSPPTNLSILKSGEESSNDECCLPAKIYMGHIKYLLTRCDYILVPRFERYERDEEFCVRFYGIYDSVLNTYGKGSFLNYCLLDKNEESGFLHMAHVLGIGRIKAGRAYRAALMAQREVDRLAFEAQEKLINTAENIKILFSAQPYLSRDPYIGAPIAEMIEKHGGSVLYSDRCDKMRCIEKSKEISASLFWTMDKEAVGAIAAYGKYVDGIVLLTAFPCGNRALVNELVLRRNKNIPTIQIVLDSLHGEAGLETRLESFMDILSERKRAYV